MFSATTSGMPPALPLSAPATATVSELLLAVALAVRMMVRMRSTSSLLPLAVTAAGAATVVALGMAVVSGEASVLAVPVGVLVACTGTPIAPASLPLVASGCGRLPLSVASEGAPAWLTAAAGGTCAELGAPCD